MELGEAFEIVKRYRPDLICQRDHICDVSGAYVLNSCPKGGPFADYTEFDAQRDTTNSLRTRLYADPSRLKP
jgi:hypothetical protein